MKFHPKSEKDKKREFIIVVGAQGAGKSVWTKNKTSLLKRLGVFDPMASYKADFETPIDNMVEPILDDDIPQFRIGTMDDTEVDVLGSTVFAAGSATLVLEEAGLFFQRGANLEQWMKQIIYTGRHTRCSIILVAQRINSIPVQIRSQASRIVCFRQYEHDDVLILSKTFGKHFRDVIPTLDNLECLDWQNGDIRRYRITPDKVDIEVKKVYTSNIPDENDSHLDK